MNFLLLCIQSVVCVTCVAAVKKAGIISFRSFDIEDAKMWFPISFLLVSVIYTGSKSLVRHVVSDMDKMLNFLWLCSNS
jgi:GDP-mannose transporter